MSEWQPIATAPKDGTLVLLYLPDSRLSNIVLGRWDISAHDEDDPYWMMENFESASPIDVKVTHWMPLPEEPA